MLVVDNIHLSYGAISALSGVSLQVEMGEIVSLIGANGAGKTSLIKAITGIQALQAGRILIQGKLVNSQKKRLASHRLVELGLALVPEGRRVFSDLSVRENLDMGGYSLRSRLEVKQQIEAMFTMFPRLQERQKQRSGLLSGGEQQMLAIARALMIKPRLLLLDEPSLGLAPLIVQEVMQSIRKINQQQGVTVLLVEQNAHQALALSQRSYILENGRVKQSGKSCELLNDPAVIQAYLGS